MEPPIQYAQTKDGVSIAFWTFGEGPAVVQMPAAAFTLSQRAWQFPEGRHWYEGLAKRRRLVRYDSRGIGHSQRDVTDFSLDALVQDLAAVVDRLGLERFVLFGSCHSGPVAIAYAARHPERVSELVLWCTSARGSDFFESQGGDALGGLREKDWAFYTEALALLIFGWSGGEQARRYAAELRQSATPGAIRAALDALLEIDAANLLPQVKSPTLVLHRRGVRLPSMDDVHHLAAHIPDARLVVLEGDSAVPYVGDMQAVLGAIDELLGEGQRAVEPAAPSGLVTILFTDMESSTALTQRLGDAGAQELVRAHNDIVRDALKAHSGSEIKHTGDGIMASFPTTSGAIDCAIAIQRAVEAGNSDKLAVRIGLNAGEPVMEEKDLFGTAVQLARRICDKADGGEIFAANVVRELAAGKGFLFSDRGDTPLRGFEDPVRVWQVRWKDG